MSISSKGLIFYCQYKTSLLGRLGRQPRLPHGLMNAAHSASVVQRQRGGIHGQTSAGDWDKSRVVMRRFCSTKFNQRTNCRRVVSCFRHQRDRRWQKGGTVRNRSKRSDDLFQVTAISPSSSRARRYQKSQPMIARRQPLKKLRRLSHLPSPTTVRTRSTRLAR